MRSSCGQSNNNWCTGETYDQGTDFEEVKTLRIFLLTFAINIFGGNSYN